MSIWLAGCAGDPDATLLGVVMVPPEGVPAGRYPAYAGSKPAKTPVAMPSSMPSSVPSSMPSSVPSSMPGSIQDEPVERDKPSPEYLYDPDSANQVAVREAPPIAYAAPAGSGVRLKSTDEVSRTEAEMRMLAQRNAANDRRGLWNSKIRDLLSKRDHHVDDAIRKIEKDDAE